MPQLSLICIGSYPGIEIFHGLGELSGVQLASLHVTRHAVTEAELKLVQSAWDAYSSGDAGELERFLAGDTSALPFLRSALVRHLARFPTESSGLGAVEKLALQFIAAGHTTFGALFRACADADPILGGIVSGGTKGLTNRRRRR